MLCRASDSAHKRQAPAEKSRKGRIVCRIAKIVRNGSHVTIQSQPLFSFLFERACHEARPKREGSDDCVQCGGGARVALHCRSL